MRLALIMIGSRAMVQRALLTSALLLVLSVLPARASCVPPTSTTTASGCDAGYIRPASIAVLLISDALDHGGSQARPEDVRAQLAGTGAFTKVDLLLFDSASNVPTPRGLLAYQAVFVLTEKYIPGFANRTVEYWEAGGAVVASAPGVCGRHARRAVRLRGVRATAVASMRMGEQYV